jgi:hypothetical protein
MKLFIFLLALIALAAAQQPLEKCPPPKTILIKRVHTVLCPSNIPYPVYKELPFDGKPLTKCPEGYTLDGPKRCVSIVRSTDICPTTYSRISDEECIKVVVLDSIEDHALACPPNYVYDEKTGCSLPEDLKLKFPTLPPIVTPKDNVKLFPKLTPIKCPFGYRKVGPYRCVKSIGCSRGFKLRRGKCIRTLKCKAGELVIANRCVIAQRCPQGLTKFGGVCTKATKKKVACRYVVNKKWSKKRKSFAKKIEKKFSAFFVKQRAGNPKKYKILISKKWSKKKQAFARKIQLTMLCLCRPKKATRKSFFRRLNKGLGKRLNKIGGNTLEVETLRRHAHRAHVHHRPAAVHRPQFHRVHHQERRHVAHHRRHHEHRHVVHHRTHHVHRHVVHHRRHHEHRHVVRHVRRHHAVPIKRVTCDLYADPHVKDFNGKYFNAQTVGDWVLHNGPTLKVAYRGKSMGSWVGVVDWHVDVKGDIVRNLGFGKVSVNGEVQNLVSGKVVPLPKGGALIQNRSTFTIRSNEGEDCDFISYGWYWNAYVRSNAPHVTGLCSHQFIESHAFANPRDAKVLPKPKVDCEHRARHSATCRKQGLKGRPRLNCVFDLCVNFARKDEKKITRQNKKEDKKKIHRLAPIRKVTCDIYADPHVKDFDGKYFNAQTAGDWVLHNGPTIKIAYRGEKHGAWVGISEWIVRIKDDVIRNTGFRAFTVNGVAAAGTVQLKSGGTVTQAGNKINVNSNEGEDVDFISGGFYFNAYVRSNLYKATGLCSHQFIRSKAFGHPEVHRIKEAPRLECERKERHMGTCAMKGLSGRAQLNCAFDLCAKFPRHLVNKAIRNNKREDKTHNVIQADRRQHHRQNVVVGHQGRRHNRVR